MVAKKKEAPETSEKVNQPDGAIVVPDSGIVQPVDRETASHQYQKNSPAINTDTAAYNPTAKVSILDQLAIHRGEQEKAKEREPELVTRAEHERRTKLDVSDPAYINPSLDHHKVK